MNKKQKKELYDIVHNWLLDKRNNYIDSLTLTIKEKVQVHCRIVDFIDFCFKEN